MPQVHPAQTARRATKEKPAGVSASARCSTSRPDAFLRTSSDAARLRFESGYHSRYPPATQSPVANLRAPDQLRFSRRVLEVSCPSRSSGRGFPVRLLEGRPGMRASGPRVCRPRSWGSKWLNSGGGASMTPASSRRSLPIAAIRGWLLAEVTQKRLILTLVGQALATFDENSYPATRHG
jgi:hypothetical protein